MNGGVVWVTGAKGFIGSHLSQALAKAGHRVVGFGRSETTQEFSTDRGFALSSQGFSSALGKFGPPSRVYHLAGGPTVGQSLTDPHGDFSSNVVTTEILLEVLRPFAQNVAVVLASSAAVYGAGHQAPIAVSDRVSPSSPYGHHKLMAEQLLHCHSNAFGLRATICRLFSIYGPGLRKQLLFDVCTQLTRTRDGAPLALGGTGNEQRDWLNVADLTAGLVGLPDPPAGTVMCHNMGSGEATSIRDMAVALVRAWGGGREVIFSKVSRPGDPFSLVADPESLPPHFAPKVRIEEGLDVLVNWYRRVEASTSCP